MGASQVCTLYKAHQVIRTALASVKDSHALLQWPRWFDQALSNTVRTGIQSQAGEGRC